MGKRKTIGLVAHDHRKRDLALWVGDNWQKLVHHNLVCTGTTGGVIEQVLNEKIASSEHHSVQLRKLKSGPLGGDQQLGALIAEGRVDMLIFLWDAMQAQPHDVDVKALLRIAVLYEVPTASNLATADFLVTSPLFIQENPQRVPDIEGYLQRKL